MKKESVDMRHLNELKQAFLKSDEEAVGFIKKSEYLKTLSLMNMKYPESFLTLFLNLIEVRDNDNKK